MGDLASAIRQATRGDDTALLAAVRQGLPGRPAVDPMSDDDPGPIPGESFDDVTAAWIAGLLTDAQYDRAVAAAAEGAGRSTGG